MQQPELWSRQRTQERLLNPRRRRILFVGTYLFGLGGGLALAPLIGPGYAAFIMFFLVPTSVLMITCG